jgi:hypothetical protein
VNLEPYQTHPNSQHAVQTFPTSGLWTSVESFDNEGNSS